MMRCGKIMTVGRPRTQPCKVYVIAFVMFTEWQRCCQDVFARLHIEVAAELSMGGFVVP